MFDLRGIASLYRIPRYLMDWTVLSRARRQRASLIDSYPCLGDATHQTPFGAHYFYQGAWLSRKLTQRPPVKHVDIGSDVQVIGVISAFIDTVFIDYRPLDSFLPGLECRQGNLAGLEIGAETVDSLSCLHVIEHIGLGRYGDPIHPEGPAKAAAELARVLAPGGSLFLSVPVGRERSR